MKISRFTASATAAVLGLSLLAGGHPVLAQDAADTWTTPALVQDPPRKTGLEPFDPKPAEYTSLSPADVTKKWNICALFPHMTNDIVRAYLYGTVIEAQRLGVRLTVYDAGGYGNVDKQLAQFDDCLTNGAEAVIVFAVSTSGLSQKINEARAAGIKVIDYNVGVDTEVDARAVVAFTGVGEAIGKELAAKHPAGSGKVQVVVMPGPAGITWSEDSVIGFRKAIEGSDVEIAKVAYGQSGRLDQQPLVEDVLITYPELDYIVGMGTSLEAALNSLREQGRVGEIGLYGTFLTPDLLAPIERGEVAGVVVENAIVLNRVTMDLTVRALEGKLEARDVIPASTMVTKDNLQEAIRNNVTPADWKVTFTVD